MGETNQSDHFDVVVIGGGIIGCVSARALADDYDVLVLEQGQIAGDASGKASGVVTFSAQRSTLPEFVDYSLSFFEKYDGYEHFEFTPRNTIELVPDSLEASARERVSGAVDNGFPLSYGDVDTIEEKYPGVFDCDRYVGGIEYRDTGVVDPYTCTMSYLEDAKDRGSEVRTDTAVSDVLVESGSVSGVRTTDGTVYGADHVVCAAGWRTSPLLTDYISVPVHPLRYQTVDLEPSFDFDGSYPIGIDPVNGLYWRPQENGSLHVGGGDYLVSNPGERTNAIKESFRLTVGTELPGILRGFDDAKLTGEDTCPTGDAATPDSLPIIDAPADGPDGLIIATGFHGYGIMASPSAGAAVYSLVSGEESPFPLDPVSLDRFESRDPEFELISLVEKRQTAN